MKSWLGYTIMDHNAQPVVSYPPQNNDGRSMQMPFQMQVNNVPNNVNLNPPEYGNHNTSMNANNFNYAQTFQPATNANYNRTQHNMNNNLNNLNNLNLNNGNNNRNTNYRNQHNNNLNNLNIQNIQNNGTNRHNKQQQQNNNPNNNANSSNKPDGKATYRLPPGVTHHSQLNDFFMFEYRVKACPMKRNCPNKAVCAGWHHEQERRRNPSSGDGKEEYRYSEEPCPNVRNTSSTAKQKWQPPSVCPDRDNCPYTHTLMEQMYHPNIYKTSMCHNYQSPTGNHCQWGYYCTHAHGPEDIRNPNKKFAQNTQNSSLGNFPSSWRQQGEDGNKFSISQQVANLVVQSKAHVQNLLGRSNDQLQPQQQQQQQLTDQTGNYLNPPNKQAPLPPGYGQQQQQQQTTTSTMHQQQSHSHSHSQHASPSRSSQHSHYQPSPLMNAQQQQYAQLAQQQQQQQMYIPQTQQAQQRTSHHPQTSSVQRTTSLTSDYYNNQSMIPNIDEYNTNAGYTPTIAIHTYDEPQHQHRRRSVSDHAYLLQQQQHNSNHHLHSHTHHQYGYDDTSIPTIPPPIISSNQQHIGLSAANTSELQDASPPPPPTGASNINSVNSLSSQQQQRLHIQTPQQTLAQHSSSSSSHSGHSGVGTPQSNSQSHSNSHSPHHIHTHTRSMNGLSQIGQTTTHQSHHTQSHHTQSHQTHQTQQYDRSSTPPTYHQQHIHHHNTHNIHNNNNNNNYQIERKRAKTHNPSVHQQYHYSPEQLQTSLSQHTSNSHNHHNNIVITNSHNNSGHNSNDNSSNNINNNNNNHSGSNQGDYSNLSYTQYEAYTLQPKFRNRTYSGTHLGQGHLMWTPENNTWASTKSNNKKNHLIPTNNNNNNDIGSNASSQSNWNLPPSSQLPPLIDDGITLATSSAATAGRAFSYYLGGTVSPKPNTLPRTPSPPAQSNTINTINTGAATSGTAVQSGDSSSTNSDTSHRKNSDLDPEAPEFTYNRDDDDEEDEDENGDNKHHSNKNKSNNNHENNDSDDQSTVVRKDSNIDEENNDNNNSNDNDNDNDNKRSNNSRLQQVSDERKDEDYVGNNNTDYERQALLERSHRLSQILTCKICRIERQDRIYCLNPCGEVVCRDCVQKCENEGKCPVCKQAFENVIRLKV